MKDWCGGEVTKKQPLKMVEVDEEDGKLVFISCSGGFVILYNPQLQQYAL